MWRTEVAEGQGFKEHHISRGCQVWLHVRVNDVDWHCFTCNDGKTGAW